jgi:hypothetical protein
MVSLIIFYVTEAPWWPMPFNLQMLAGFEEKGSDFSSFFCT